MGLLFILTVAMKKPDVHLKFSLSGHAAPVYCLEQGSKTETVFSGSADGFVAEWDVLNGAAEKFSVNVGKPVYSLLHDQEKQVLFIGLGTGDLHIIDLLNKKEIKHIIHHQSAIFQILLHKKNNHFYTVSGDGTCCIWDRNDFRLMLNYPICSEKIRKMTLSPSGDFLALACGDGWIRIFETSFYNLVQEWKAHEMACNSICFLDEDTLLSGGKDAYLNFWKRNGSLIRSIPAHNFAIYDIKELTGTAMIATASRDKTIKLWRTDTLGILLRIDRKLLDAHKNSVNALHWIPSLNRLISTGDDRSIKVMEIK